MAEFKRKNIVQLLKMDQAKVEEYYRELRKYNFQKDKDISKMIRLRKLIHHLTVKILMLNRMLMKQTLTIIGDKRIDNGKPRIYAVTHIGRYDIEISVEALKDNAYFLWGDPKELYLRPERIILEMIGMNFVDTHYKEDRHIALENMVKIAKSGGNNHVYPEAAWNITPNLVVMPLFTGCIEAGIRGGADVIPVAIEQYDKDYYVNIGENIDCSKMKMEDKRIETDKLRDAMCTLKWEIWEQKGISKRKDLPDNYEETFINNIMKDTDNGYTVEDIEKERFHDKNITTYEEAFAFQKKLK